MAAKLRVGLIGAGDISQYHLAAWEKAEHAAVVAVCDRDATRARSRASAFGISAVYTDAAAMLAAEKLDAVDIATWRETHVELTRLAAAHGVHGLCQKPLAPTLNEAESLAAEVAGRIRLMVNENRRFAPHFRGIRRWLDEGRVGPVRQCVSTMHRSGFIKDANGRRPAVERAPFMAREPRLMIAETLIHQFDAGIAHFVERLRANLPFETGPDDNLRTLKLVEDAYALAARGQSANFLS